MFQLYYDKITKHLDNAKVHQRLACKGVASKNGKILFIQTNKGDFKFPGGGSKKNESHEDTLYREFLEETGYEVITVGSLLGEVIERKPDDYEPGAIFEMKSLYYACEISDSATSQNLDEYEAELEFTVKFASKEEAWTHNRNLLNTSQDVNAWLQRETDVLCELMNGE